MTLRQRVLEALTAKAMPARVLYGMMETSREALDAAMKGLRESGLIKLQAGHFCCAESGGRAGVTPGGPRHKRRPAPHAMFGWPLTLREVEIADLAAAGLTSKQIASSLGVTRKTVEGHLSYVYAKLGATGRHDLAQRLSEREGAR